MTNGVEKMDDENLDDFTDYWSSGENWYQYQENDTLCNYTEENQWQISTSEVAIKTTITVLMSTSGLYLNSVILLVLIKNKYLWSPTNTLIGNLAFVDFIILLICPWFMLFRDFNQNYVLGSYGCLFDGFSQALLLLANVGAVMLVSYDRVAAAALAVEARVTKTGAPKLIAISWLGSILIALPLIFASNYMEVWCPDYVVKFCQEDNTVLSVYWHFVLLLLVWIPLGVMFVTYGTIIWRLGKTSKELQLRGGGQSVTKAKGKTLRVTACVLLADIVCSLPYSLMVYWSNNFEIIRPVNRPFENMWFTAQFLMYANCALNPLIYGFTNTRFRKAMDRTPGVAWCKFGSWCCVCTPCQKNTIDKEDKNTEKIYVIEISPKPAKKLKKLLQKVLHINKDAIDFNTTQKVEAINSKENISPLQVDDV